MSQVFNLVRFAIPSGDSPQWDQISPLIDDLQAATLADWTGLFADIDEIEDLLNPYDPEDPDHQKALPLVKAQLHKDVQSLSEAIHIAPTNHLLVSSFHGWDIYFVGGMVEEVGPVNSTHGAALRLDWLGGLTAAGFSDMEQSLHD